MKTHRKNVKNFHGGGRLKRFFKGLCDRLANHRDARINGDQYE